jgi:twitching motility protein PilT
MAQLDAYLQLGTDQGASDLHLTVGRPPLVRLDGELVELQYRALTAGEIQALLFEVLDPAAVDELHRNGAIDLAYAAPDGSRFRLNVFHQLFGIAAICRRVPGRVPRLTDLALPPVLAELCALPSGLVLVTGGPGTGKTTTLAALIGEINATRNCNVITLEDPVEFSHESDKALVMQRQVGIHARSFQEGLRSSLRQDPDVLLIGEMRDNETMTAAIEAAETGHLVFGTLHTRSAAQTIHRIVDAFPAEQQAQIRHTLADTLRAVVSQELVHVADGRGRRVVCEVMIVTAAIAQLVREGKTHQIPAAIGTGRRLGMQLLDQALLAYVRSGDIDPNEAFLKATDKSEFVLHVTRPELLAAVERGPATRAAGA